MSAKGKNSAAGCFHDILVEERAVFAIGGVISSTEPSSLSGPKSFMPSPTSRSLPSVTIRWEDLADKPICHTVSLPVLDDGGEEEFADLVREYHEGRGVNDFMVNFSPYDYGIPDAIGRLLYPGYDSIRPKEVKASLRSLDVYSSGRSQTMCCDPEPRSDQDFGRLLVCLPYKHKGGSITLLRREHEDDTERMELEWAEKSGSCKIQWVAFLNPTDVSQTKMICGHSVVLTYTLSRTTYRMGEAPVPLPILDVTTHSWYRIVERAVEMSLPKVRSIGKGGITIGYTCTGEYSFPLIKFSLSAGEGLQGFLTGGDLLVYHIFARLARDVRTRIILDEPIAIQPFTEYALSVRCRPIVIPDSQGESQEIGISDDEQERWDAADPLPPPDLPENICWLNYSPWSPSGSWREMLLSVGHGRGRKGLEGRLCRTVVVATLTPGQKERDLATPATAAATSQSQKRKRLLEEDSPRSEEELTLRPGDEGYVDLTGVLDEFTQPRTCPGCHGCSQCTNSGPRNAASRVLDFSSLLPNIMWTSGECSGMQDASASQHLKRQGPIKEQK